MQNFEPQPAGLSVSNFTKPNQFLSRESFFFLTQGDFSVFFYMSPSLHLLKLIYPQMLRKSLIELSGTIYFLFQRNSDWVPISSLGYGFFTLYRLPRYAQTTCSLLSFLYTVGHDKCDRFPPFSSILPQNHWQKSKLYPVNPAAMEVSVLPVSLQIIHMGLKYLGIFFN